MWLVQLSFKLFSSISDPCCWLLALLKPQYASNKDPVTASETCVQWWNMGEGVSDTLCNFPNTHQKTAATLCSDWPGVWRYESVQDLNFYPLNSQALFFHSSPNFFITFHIHNTRMSSRRDCPKSLHAPSQLHPLYDGRLLALPLSLAIRNR